MGGRYSRSLSEPVRPTEHQGRRHRNESENSAEKTVYWMSFLDGFQRVIIFTDDPIFAAEMRKVGYHFVSIVILQLSWLVVTATAKCRFNSV
jgi:hypothetical protein